jgi:hypothetical protein
VSIKDLLILYSQKILASCGEGDILFYLVGVGIFILLKYESGLERWYLKYSIQGLTHGNELAPDSKSSCYLVHSFLVVSGGIDSPVGVCTDVKEIRCHCGPFLPLSLHVRGNLSNRYPDAKNLKDKLKFEKF